MYIIVTEFFKNAFDTLKHIYWACFKKLSTQLLLFEFAITYQFPFTIAKFWIGKIKFCYIEILIYIQSFSKYLFLKFLQIYIIYHPKFVVQFGSICRLFSNVMHILSYEDLHLSKNTQTIFFNLKRENGTHEYHVAIVV